MKYPEIKKGHVYKVTFRNKLPLIDRSYIHLHYRGDGLAARYFMGDHMYIYITNNISNKFIHFFHDGYFYYAPFNHSLWNLSNKFTLIK